MPLKTKKQLVDMGLKAEQVEGLKNKIGWTMFSPPKGPGYVVNGNSATVTSIVVSAVKKKDRWMYDVR